MLAKLDNASFSMNVLMVPLLLSALSGERLTIGWVKNPKVWSAWLLVLLAGLLFASAALPAGYLLLP